MIPVSVLMVVLGATDVSVGLVGFQGTQDIGAEKREFFLEYLSQKLAEGGGLKVLTPSQISALIGVERQRQLLGCSEGATSCLAEVAGAVGTESLVIGSVAKVGAEFALTVKAIDARTGEVIESASARESKEEALLDFLGSAANSLRAALLLRLRGIEPSRGARWLKPGPLAIGVLGVAALVTSGVMFGVAKGMQNRLLSGDPTVGGRADAAALASSGGTVQTVSGVLLGVGVAMVATGILWLFVGGDDHAAVTQWLFPEAAQAAWSSR